MKQTSALNGPFSIIADMDTPVSAYTKLAPLKPRYLLESVEGGLRLARYSFLGFGRALAFTFGDARFYLLQQWRLFGAEVRNTGLKYVAQFVVASSNQTAQCSHFAQDGHLHFAGESAVVSESCLCATTQKCL